MWRSQSRFECRLLRQLCALYTAVLIVKELTRFESSANMIFSVRNSGVLSTSASDPDPDSGVF